VIAKDDDDYRKSRILIAGPVVGTKPGDLNLELALFFSQAVPHAKVTVREEPYHTWIPLKIEGAGGKAEWVIRSIAPQAAYPDWFRNWPLLFEGKAGGREGHGKKTDRLPLFVPERIANPGVRLNVVDDVVKLTSVNALTERHPAYLLLSRWWVNGKPFIPGGKVSDDYFDFGGFEAVKGLERHEITLKLGLD
jgi:hypothetical protein